MSPEVKKNEMTYADFYSRHRPTVHHQILDELVSANAGFVIDSWMRSMMLGAQVSKQTKRLWAEDKERQRNG